MAVPEEVRKVPRPRNTVVIASSTGRYAVRSRTGCRYSVDADGKRHRTPVNGPVVGYIEDGVYTPVGEVIPLLGEGGVDVKDWGNVVLWDARCRGVLDELRGFYNEEDARTIYAVAMLRGCYGVSDRMLERQYEETYLTEMYPGLDLGRTAVCRLMRNLGRECGRISRFMRARASALDPDDVAVVDGTLKTYDSTLSSYSAASRRTRLTGREHMSVMYAYSLSRREPLCSKPYSGNTVDARAIRDFAESADLRNGLIVADRGFPPSAVREAASGRPGLHWLIPLRRDSLMIDRYGMLSFDGRLEGEDGVQCRRAHAADPETGDVWLYSFRTPGRAAEEERVYMLAHTGDAFDPADLERERARFGTVVFESDLEMDCATVMSVYDSRWIIEMFFKFGKSELGLDDVREHSDYSVTGSAFVDFLAALMGTRVLGFMESRGMLERMTFGDVDRSLRRLKATDSGTGEWRVCRVPKAEAEVAARLGVLARPVVPAEKRKPGRPKGSKDRVPRKRRGSREGAQPSG